MKRQIEGELAWRRLLGRRVEPFVNVGEEEVNAVIKRLEAAKGTEEYHIAEIYLSSTPETNAQTLENANRIVEQIKAVGQGRAHGVQIHQPAPDAEFARRHDLGHVGIAAQDHLLAQPFHVGIDVKALGDFCHFGNSLNWIWQMTHPEREPTPLYDLLPSFWRQQLTQISR